MLSDDDSDFERKGRRAEQQGGNPLFNVQCERVGQSRSWQNGTAVIERVRLRLEEARVPVDEKLGEAISEAFDQELRKHVRESGFDLDQHSLQMAIHHNSDTHVWTRSPPMPLREWVEGGQRSNAWLDKLAKELNSSEGLDATGGEFYAELLFVKNRSIGSGCRRKKGNPGNLSYEQLLKKKRCIIEIKNKDELCAARALVTMKALADDDPQYVELRRDRGFQKVLAKTLHREVDVPEGPCGLPEEIQQFMGPSYQILVFEGMQGLLWYKYRAYDNAPKKIVLLKAENHFHGVTSIPTLLNRSYYCFHCEKTYDSETSEKHNCVGQNCDACKRTNKTCPNFATFVTPEVYCSECNRCFYGQNCFEAHKQGKKDKIGKERLPSVCSQVKQCPECCKKFKPSKKKKQKKRTGIRMVGDDSEEEVLMPEEEENGEEKQKAQPLVCVIDFECGKDENKSFEEYRVGWRYIGEEGSYREVGTALEMLQNVMEKTVTEDGKERKVFVYAHNMRGFDSSFILNVLYRMGYKVVKVLSQGAKFLSFECGDMVFRDSLNFFNMPLEKLPATFNLEEAHKGFFAYDWICPEKYDYVGPYPPAADYHPERMNEKRRKEFLAWHKEKIESGAVFDFQKELSAYLKSDVEVLTGSLAAFSEEMVELTGIDPVTECVTIASTAFKVWQKMFLKPNLIALEPHNGSRKNQVNQTVEAIEWLEYENFKRGGGIQVSLHKLRN